MGNGGLLGFMPHQPDFNCQLLPVAVTGSEAVAQNLKNQSLVLQALNCLWRVWKGAF